MKKALVMTFVLVLGLGFAAFAAGELSGTIDISASFVPDASDFDDFVNSMSATIEIDYAIGGCTFGSSTGFDLDGYSSQSFSAEGALGAFSFTSTMKFKPNYVTKEEWTYDVDKILLVQTASISVCDVTYARASVPQSASDVVWDTCWWKDSDYAAVVKTTGPAFDEWTATGGVSIAGLSLEATFFLEGFSGATASKPYAFYWDGLTGVTGLATDVVQTSPVNGTALNNINNIWGRTADLYVGGFVGAATKTGSGFLFKAAGTAGDMTITSYTYFNLTEAAAKTACGACGYSFARKGAYKIANAGCDVTFTEEYLTIEGLSFGCATVDVAVSIGCSGFSSLKVLINDFDLGFCCSGITIDGLLTFTTSSKTFTIAPCVTMRDVCLEFEVALSYAANAINALNIYGVSFEQTWNGITFTSKTAFDIDKSCLFGKTGKSVTDASKQIQVLVPLTGLYTCAEATCPIGCEGGECTTTKNHVPSIILATTGEGFYTPWCIYTEKYVVWEAFSVAVDGDSCCGGAFDLTVDTYFGTKKCLDYWVWRYQFYALTPTAYDYDDTEGFDVVLGTFDPADTIAFATADAPDDISADGLASGVTYEEDLTKKAYYADSAGATLFAWVQTDVALNLGIGSAWTLTGGMSVDAYGWNSLSFGFEFEF